MKKVFLGFDYCPDLAVYYVYLLENSAKNRHYVGYTVDIEKRLTVHNAGKVKSTRPFGPWRCIYSEKFTNKSDALKREWHLKHAPGRKEKLGIITKCKDR